MSYEHLTDEELYECHSCAYEMLGDNETQYRSEIALYGDAWPGAAIQLDAMRADLAEIETELAARQQEREAEEVIVGDIPEWPEVNWGDDIPF